MVEEELCMRPYVACEGLKKNIFNYMLNKYNEHSISIKKFEVLSITKMTCPDFLLNFIPDEVTDSDVEEIEVPKGRPKKLIDSFMNLEETFDQHKLNHIIENEEKYTQLMRAKCFGEDYNPFVIAKKYLNKSHNGKLNVCYKQNDSLGRFYAVGALSMQGLPREIRHTIGTEYTDIDMKNAHPVILLHLCGLRNILTPNLKRYVKKRDEMTKLK